MLNLQRGVDDSGTQKAVDRNFSVYVIELLGL